MRRLVAILPRIRPGRVAVGKSADLVVIDNNDRQTAVAELSQPLMGFKRGHMTFQREPAELLWPQ